MTLQEGEYLIPYGYTAKLVGRTVWVYKTRRNTLKEGDYRCRDCSHFTRGFSINSRILETNVCAIMVRKVFEGKVLYKAALPYDKPCSKFKKIEGQ